MQLCPKIQDIGAKNAPVWVFVSCIYIIRYHTNRESSITRVLFVPNITSANVILYNSSVNKKLILCYILKTILCVFAKFCREHITFKATAELGYCASSSNTAVFSFWMNPRFERIVWINDSKRSIHKESCLLNSWINQPFELIEWRHLVSYLEYHFIK